MDGTVRQFYDDLADNYHLIFADWRKAVYWQGEVLDNFIRSQLANPSPSVLDCSCGIGTQAIGLALRGYQLHATDLSQASVERAKAESKSFSVSITFGVADLRNLAEQVDGKFDLVLSCDNALPHLSSHEDLLLAARNIRAKLQPGGLFLASIRDYDELLRERPRSTLPRVFEESAGKRIVFQVWDWLNGGCEYIVHQFIINEVENDWKTIHQATLYRALLRQELTEILIEAGLSKIGWHMPSETGYYQPIVTARYI